MQALRTFIVLALAVGVAGCINDSEQTSNIFDTASEPGARGKYTTYGIADSPPFESGIVTRGEDSFAAFNIADNANLLQMVGIAAHDYCAGNFDFDIVSLQQVSLPDAQRLIYQLRGEVRVEVYERPVGCFNLDTQFIASGTATLISTDNDLSPDGPNRNVWGWNTYGTLYGPDGQAFQYSSAYKFMYVPRLNAQIPLVRHITLTPVTAN